MRAKDCILTPTVTRNVIPLQTWPLGERSPGHNKNDKYIKILTEATKNLLSLPGINETYNLVKASPML